MRPTQRKRGQVRKSKPRVRRRLNKDGDPKAGKSGATPLIALNVNDTLVMETLNTAAAGELAVDSLLLDSRQTVPELRAALVDIYLKAGKDRQASKATKDQLKHAKSALSRLGQALKSLERVSTDGRDGLRMLLEGPPSRYAFLAGVRGWISRAHRRKSWSGRTVPKAFNQDSDTSDTEGLDVNRNNRWRRLLRCMSPFLALSGHSATAV
jgi:hypothetical protein